MSTPPIYAEMTAYRLYGDEYYPSTDSESSKASLHDAKVHYSLKRHGLRIGHDGFVEWKNYDPQLPWNWSITKKAYNDILICFLQFWMTAMSSSGVRSPWNGCQCERSINGRMQ